MSRHGASGTVSKLHGSAIPKAARDIAAQYPDADATTLATKLREVHPGQAWEPANIAKWTGRPITSNGRMPPPLFPPHPPRIHVDREPATLPEMIGVLTAMVGIEATRAMLTKMLQDMDA